MRPFPLGFYMSKAETPSLRYEVNNRYREQLVAAGLVVSGTYQQERLVEIIELPSHPFFIASQFHPEFKSRPDQPHPLFSGFIAAAIERRRAPAARPAGTVPKPTYQTRRLSPTGHVHRVRQIPGGPVACLP